MSGLFIVYQKNRKKQTILFYGFYKNKIKQKEI